MTRLTITLGAVTLAASLIVTSAATAARYEPDETRYTATDKLLRGLAGMTTGFLELPGNIMAENRDHGAAAAATIGFAKGVGMIPVRELVGVFNFVTAPIEIPENYEPMLHPEYPWDYFDGAPSASFNRNADYD